MKNQTVSLDWVLNQLAGMEFPKKGQAYDFIKESAKSSLEPKPTIPQLRQMLNVEQKVEGPDDRPENWDKYQSRVVTATQKVLSHVLNELEELKSG